MMTSVSAVGLVKERPGFGQSMRPGAGSIIASPVPGAYDPDPDYFFHWFRDSAVVIDAVRLLFEAGHSRGGGAPALRRLRAVQPVARRAGRSLARRGAALARRTSCPDFEKYVRPDEELAARAGRRGVRRHARESRRHARHLAVGSPAARWPAAARAGGAASGLRKLRRCTRRRCRRHCSSAISTSRAKHWRDPSFDIWEEELGPPLLHAARFRGGVE